MERLLTQLVERGAVDAADADWARGRQAELGGPLDTALLELDLVDEAELLRALRGRFERPVASRQDVSALDRDLSARLPPGFSTSFSLCPLRFVGTDLLTLVPSPIPAESRQELRELFGLNVRELLGPAHWVAMARAAVYGKPPDDRNRELARRLARRNDAPDFVSVANRMAESRSISASMDDLLALAEAYFEHACFLVPRGDRLHVIRAGHRDKKSIARPPGGCTLGPALSFGGYFVGGVGGSDPDRRFFAELGRPVPKKAFVAPVPEARGGRLVFYADNGPRGMPARWIAELSVLLGRLARGAGRGLSPGRAARGAIAGWDSASQSRAATAPAMSDSESRALRRLREAASRSGLELETLVERLLASEGEPAKPRDSTSALVGEMKGLFERLATDIPAHLARGMEVAFRELAPRLAPAAEASPIGQRRPAADLVVSAPSAAPREVESYASRRQKTARVKL